ncbi:hypothetical protein [Gordonia sp. N1V]|uniref:hypothetical protein n=1 Tax=Gordonia sp. N1V TaxID=3034163 RepID=UPI0023E31643|nr:hypothetical protein [Gordonia sp. N1V]MDF3280484.1 hypothetical protein [Gordonia sp. N1V]
MPVSITPGDRDPQITETDAERALLAGAEVLLDESNRNVPLETGTLERSGNTAASGYDAAVGYNTPYAVRQHEEVGYTHKGKGEAKFLENAMHNHRDAILGAISDTLRQALGG